MDGLGVLGSGLSDLCTKRCIKLIHQKGERTWSEARVKGDRWAFDRINHLVCGAGIVLISVASMRIDVSASMFVVATVGLIAAISRLVFVKAKIAACQQGLE